MERLVKQVECKDAQLLVARYRMTHRMDFFFDYVANRGIRPEVLALFQQITPGMTLGFDPHPSAEGHLAMATRMAQQLVDLGWVKTKAEAPLPEVEGLFAEHQAPPFDWDEVATRTRAQRRANQHRLRAVIEPDRGKGLAQIYGGMSPEGNVGSGLLALLGLNGPTITVRLAPISSREDLYPIELTVYADGLFVGQLTLSGTAPTTVEFAVPEALGGKTVADIEIRAEHWGVLTKNGRSVTASFRLEQLSCRAAR
ncbi:MAG: hypothetical protein ACI9EF_002218 [Pseudohongiellaceae bacterium]